MTGFTEHRGLPGIPETGQSGEDDPHDADDDRRGHDGWPYPACGQLPGVVGGRP
ncbi:hypothetical protein [Actinophytocola glycyrrhizae]|uniref:Uncharacterized protein n=1 Tax=Actinophytocola glycyrrhizae TaxID=2044873 RepID=A0ABV9SEA5_9PSEU